jgi:hypothetical protein
MAQPNSAPSSAPVSVIGSQFIAQDQFDIIVDRYANGNLLVTDINHKILLKVKPCTTHFNSQLVVLDADDKPIVTIREQSLTAHGGMNVFRGDSKNKSDLIFHTKKHHLIQMKTNVDVFLGNKASGKHVNDFNIKGNWSKKDCTINRGDTSATIAQMYKMQSTDKKKFVNDKFMTTIYPTVDYVFVVTLIAIVEAMEMESTSNEKEYRTATGKVVNVIGNVSSALSS